MTHIAIVGSGLIGRAWATVFASHGCSVALHDVAPGAAESARAHIGTNLEELAGHGLVEDPKGSLARIRVARDLADVLTGADLVQENGPETVAAKQQLFAEMDALFMATEYRVIEDEASTDDLIAWWETMTEDGHEGIVIKPERFVTQVDGKLVQPAIKVRGRKYLHIIYGMDYLEPNQLRRLKKRNVSKKQKLALREFALGVEGITRFVEQDSLERYHECVLATLAMEAEPVDPRL